MSSAMFMLDEEKDFPATSPQPSPPITSNTERNIEPILPLISSTSDATPTPSKPIPSSNLLAPQPQPFMPSLGGHRRQTTSFAATPSFPSPLAQAITVPLNSDTSSSSSHSDDDEREELTTGRDSPISTSSGTPKRRHLERPRTASPNPSRGSGSRTGSPSSTDKSTSRPPSPSTSGLRPTPILTPSGLLMKGKRSASGPSSTSPLSGSLPNFSLGGSGAGGGYLGMGYQGGNGNSPSPSSPLRESPPRLNPSSSSSSSSSAIRKDAPFNPNSQSLGPSTSFSSSLSSRKSSISSTNANNRANTISGPRHHRAKSNSSSGSGPLAFASSAGDSPLAFGSPELYPIEQRRRSISGSLEDQDNSLGLGLAWGGGSGSIGSREKGHDLHSLWETGSTASISSFGSGTGSSSTGAKGKGKEVPPSPRRERNTISSPPRQRRPSEFLNPIKMPHGPGGRQSLGSVPSLSTSASMISPLNPLPSPWTNSTDSSTATSPGHPDGTNTGSSAGAIRVTKVPAAVKLATELLKNTNPASSVSSPSVAMSSSPTHSASPSLSAGVITPSPSPIGAHTPIPPASAPAPAPGSMGPPPIPPPAALDIGKGRPTLAVPAPPPPSRFSSSTDHEAITGAQRSASLAPPSSFRVVSASSTVQPKTRPSEPALAPPFSTKHKYRTSMHESRPIISEEIHNSPPSWSPEAESSTSSAPGTGKMGQYGLGLNMPSHNYLHPLAQANASASGSLTPGGRSPSGGQRMRTTTDKTLQMDLAGILPQLGDAASHAGVIMQSRQAKLQRWRPNSSGQQGGDDFLAPPPFMRSTTSTSARTASSQGSDKDKRGLGIPGAVDTSSPGQDLPFIPQGIGRTTSVVDPPSATFLPVHSKSSGNFAPHLMGGMGMERQMSAGGTVGGVEWVDWYDCYKRYKEQKLKAEAQAARVKDRIPEDPASESSTPLTLSNNPSKEASPETDAGDETLKPNEVDLSEEPASAISLTPTTSRDEFRTPISYHPTSPRHRSSSIKSNLSLMDPRLSPSQKRGSIFERPRQASGSSVRSTDSISAAQQRKKKNLVTKMEGWWNAVKSNFIPESQHPPYRPSQLGPGGTPKDGSGHDRIPSAPSSRRGSEMSPISAPAPALLAPEPIREVSRSSERSSQSLRNATSHTELRTSQKESFDQVSNSPGLSGSTSGDIARLSRRVSGGRNSTNFATTSNPHRLSTGDRKPSVVEEESDTPTRTSLDSRRNQPNLRLDLESNVLRKPQSRGYSSTSEKRPGSSRPSDTSGSSSYNITGIPMYGPGLTPGVMTGSPIFPVNTSAREARENRENKENKPVAPGAELTVASVRRHIKHRLDGAKEICNHKLRETIAAITRFAGEQKAQELEDNQDEYFEAISDSPLVDADDSDTDMGMIPSRNASSSRGPSRRASISRPGGMVAQSPSRRLSMLPTSPSRPRRRTSTAPRTYVGRDRGIRNFSLSSDQRPMSHSASSSRSTSRSRSPMPGHRPLLDSHAGLDDSAEADKQFLAALQELIVLATDIIDMSVNKLLAEPTAIPETIQKIQRVGQNWDEHDDWPGRSWYVEILMAVAKLSQVLDWWELEKGFWNFDEEEVENEPLLFVMKPQTREEISRFDEQFGAALSRPQDTGSAQPGSSPAFSTATLPDVGPDGPPSLSLEIPSPLSPTSMPLSATRSDTLDTAIVGETPKAQASEDLQVLAAHAKSVNIVMELGLQGEDVQYVNDAILEVTGQDPEDVLTKSMSDLVAPADAATFAEATAKLLEDDSNTVQLRVRFEVHAPEDEVRAPGPVYVELEGVGMLMREHGLPSHTMWVLKPVPALQIAVTDTTFPADGKIAMEGILCRICERDIATWFFEKHNETCDAVHRLEAEITECDECLNDLRQTVLMLQAQIDDVDAQPAQYQGVLFMTLPESIASAAAVGGDDGSAVQPQLVERRKVAHEHLEDVADILQIAQQIDAPSVREDEADLPFTLQRYLDRDSEERLAIITRWQRPQTSDSALSLLFNHVEEQLRRKQKGIARMQSTIRYSEKTRHEWEDKVNRVLAEQDSGSDSGSDGPGDISLATTAGATEGEPGDSPPGHRKIAPQARLPVTQGHRPSTSHGESYISTVSTVPPTPLTRPSTSAAAPMARVPSQPGPLPFGAKPPDNVSSRQNQIPRKVSPLQLPPDGGAKLHARRPSKAFRDAPLSPRIPSASHNRTAPPSIKDFEIIKPISRGAFGSVYLAKKVATGDYFAIKALKKSDMIAKNQITNVKAERTILMNQASSPYVAKLFFSFQSREYLYLVMEYLNGGDCANLVKTIGSLPEDWARNYIAEVVLGLEYLHARNIVHRDIKPDNLLIDAKGHLKLTDFGLSRIGLLNRQVGGPRPAYLRGTSLGARRPFNLRTASISSSDSPMLSPDIPYPSSHASHMGPTGYFGSIQDSGSADESSGSESAGNIITKHMRQHGNKQSSDLGTPLHGGRDPPRFVGTPDYLAPESILGIGTDDKVVDWWALGVVLYEFLYGIPPFHDESPEKVFDNIVSRRIDWHTDEVELSPAAHDLMDRLMCSNPTERLGARGAEEVKQHAFFAGMDWEHITEGEASFVPQVTDPESTDYFDARGAIHGFHDEDPSPTVLKAHPFATAQETTDMLSPGATEDMKAVIKDITGQEDFGTFNFRNLPVLKAANDDMIKKLRVDSMAAIGQTLDAAPNMRERPRSLSAKMRERAKRKPSDLIQGPPSPATSTSSANSTPSRSSAAPTTPSTVPPMPIMPQHFRRPSELNALDRVKSSDDGDLARRSSAPTRIRAGSGGSSFSDRSASMELWRQKRQALQTDTQSQSSSVPPSTAPLDSPEMRSAMMDRTLDVLIAEDNPISQKILETLLTRMGCRCVCVEDGPQALAATMGIIKFDIIICDLQMPIVNGEDVARMIRSTSNHNQNTPIIAATSYEQHQVLTEEGTLFSAVLPKPVSKGDLLRCLEKLGFILASTATAESISSSSGPVSAY